MGASPCGSKLSSFGRTKQKCRKFSNLALQKGKGQSPKDVTRISPGLLVFRSIERSKISMRKSKMHFEQIPVEVVKKIAEEESPRESDRK